MYDKIKRQQTAWCTKLALNKSLWKCHLKLFGLHSDQLEMSHAHKSNGCIRRKRLLNHCRLHFNNFSRMLKAKPLIQCNLLVGSMWELRLHMLVIAVMMTWENGKNLTFMSYQRKSNKTKIALTFSQRIHQY